MDSARNTRNGLRHDMPYGKHPRHCFSSRQRFVWALCTGVAVAALPVAFGADGLSAIYAHAQQADRASRALLLAVEKNDLPGVQAAIDGGADVEARNFNGMQAVDLAIERGYFDIAHYLITIRNRIQAKDGQSVAPAPSPDQLAEAQKQKLDAATIQPDQPGQPDQPTAPQEPNDIPQGGANPFDSQQADTGLPVIGDVREPVGQPSTAAIPSQTAQGQEAPTEPSADAASNLADKPSASKTFVTTFFDFFKPPNTTGIVRKEQAGGQGPTGILTDEELNREIQAIEKDIGDDVIKGPDVSISPEEMAREFPPAPDLPTDMTDSAEPAFQTTELPPYQVQSADILPRPRSQINSDQAFGDLEIAAVTPADEQPIANSSPPSAPQEQTPPEQASGDALDSVLDTQLPFDGKVDPDILYLLGMSEDGQPAPPSQTAQADPFASPPSDPFAAPSRNPFAEAPSDAPSSDAPSSDAPSSSGADTVAGVLEGIGEPQEVLPLDAKKPPSPDGAQTPPDPFASAPQDPFAAQPGEVDELAGLLEDIGEEVSSKQQDGWDVKAVDGANLPGELPTLSNIEPTGNLLDGVQLALGADTVIGQPVGEDRLKMLDQETIHKPCLSKGGQEAVYCIDKVNWAFDLEENFLVDTIMYQGTRAVARYDAGRASRFHVLFKTEATSIIVNHYISRFGPPTEKVDRAIAPLAQPRRDNPTYIWRSREPGTDTVITLEIRQFDDARGEFPDTKRGVILLYRDHAGEIFPMLSQLELMVLKESGAMDMTPKTPDSVW